MDIERAKKDIIYFAEDIMGYQLQNWQKELLLRYQEGELILFGSYRAGKNMVVKIINENKKLIKKYV